ncbi:MAG: PEP-CTERM sorting domain-containing protein [Burkholderiales bacterium]
MKTAPIASAILVLSALTVTPAFAAGSASVSTGPLVVTLTDLDLTDGITPSITFFQYGWERSSVYVNAGTGTGDYEEGTSGYAPVWISQSGLGSSAAASVVGDGTALGTTLTASATSSDVYSLAPSTYLSGESNSGVSGSFKLSGATLAIFSINFTAAASGAGYYEDPITSSFYGEDAEAGASLRVIGPGAFGGGGSYQESDVDWSTFVDIDVPTSGPLVSYDRTVSQSLKVTFLNLTKGDLAGDLEIDAYAYSDSSALPAVPEPGTSAMLLAGLAAVGFALRKKRA